MIHIFLYEYKTGEEQQKSGSMLTTLPETFSLSEQLPPNPYTDAGTDDRNDKSRYRSICMKPN